MQFTPSDATSLLSEKERSTAPRQQQILKRHQDYCAEKFFSSHLDQTTQRRRRRRRLQSSKVWHEKKIRNKRNKKTEKKTKQNKKLKELNATSKKGKTASGARTRNMVKTKLRGPTPPTMDIMCNNNKNQFKPTFKQAA